MTSKTFLLADGTNRIVAHLAPIHYQSADGSWQPINTTIGPSANAGYAASCTANTLRTYFPATSAGWVRAETDHGAVSMRPLEVTSRPSTVEGNAVTSIESWPNTNVQHEVRPGLLKETLTLATPGGPTLFAFALQMEGLAARLEPDRSVSFLDTAGNRVMTIAAPWMRDAAGRFTTQIDVCLSQQDGETIYAVSIDPAWLASARYPVILDPTIGPVTRHRTEVVRKSQPTSDYRPGISDGNGGYLLAAGVTDWYQTDAYRTVLFFDNVSIPADNDVITADLAVSVLEGRGLDSIPTIIQAVSLPNYEWDGVGSWNVVNDYFSADAALRKLPLVSPPVTLGEGSEGNTAHFDVSGLVSDWADGYSSQSIMLLDAMELDSGYVNENYAYFDVSDPSLTIETIPGWYTFQGNMRRTGRTGYSISPTATQRWDVAKLAYTSGYLPPICPSLLAVPDPDSPSSGLPIVFACVTNGNNLSRVYRIKDNGDGQSPSVSQPFEVSRLITGTPLYYGGRVYVTARNTASTAGYMYILHYDSGTDTMTLAWSDTVQHPNPVEFTGPVYSSLALNPANDGILVAANSANSNAPNGTGYDGILYCKSSTTGLPLYTEATLPALSVFDDESRTTSLWPSWYGSPSVCNGRAYVPSDLGWVNARYLSDGSQATSPEYSINEDGYPSTPMIFEGRLYVGYTLDQHSPPEGEQAGVGSFTSPALADFWKQFNPYGYENSVWATPALSIRPNGAEADGVIYGDDDGLVHGVSALPNLGSIGEPGITWDDGNGGYGTYQVLDPYVAAAVHASPLVAGSYVFVGADDGGVHVLHADTGLPYDSNNPILGGSRFATPIRSSMAAYQGRLYIQTAGGHIYCFH